jgi:hypothetical protein
MLAGDRSEPRFLPDSFRRSATNAAMVAVLIVAIFTGFISRSKWSREMFAAARVCGDNPSRTRSLYSLRNSSHFFLLLVWYVPASNCPSVLRASFSAASLPVLGVARSGVVALMLAAIAVVAPAWERKRKHAPHCQKCSDGSPESGNG